MMENKGCITCRKCEQVRSNFFCGRTRLSQKQLYNKHGFCSDYEPKEQIEKPMTKEEWFCQLSTEEKAEWITDKINAKLRMALHDAELYPDDINENEYMENEDEWVEWLKQPHANE